MRQAYQDTKVIKDDNGDLILIAFGYDHCAEHECGMNGFWNAFDIPGPSREKQGPEARQITKTAGTLERKTFRKSKKLGVGTQYVMTWRLNTYGILSLDKMPSELATSAYASEERKTLTCAWSSGPGAPDFGIRTTDKKILDDLEAAFERRDVSIWATRGGPFGGSGLVLAVTSKIPESEAELMREEDLERIRLADAAEATGIEAKLKEFNSTFTSRWDAPCRWFALSPRWRRDHDESPSAHPVMFFLNPMAQDKNNYGWFTVEELEQWMEGKGPIPKN